MFSLLASQLMNYPITILGTVSPTPCLQPALVKPTPILCLTPTSSARISGGHPPLPYEPKVLPRSAGCLAGRFTAEFTVGPRAGELVAIWPKAGN